jgi:hypothetical protein
MLKQDNEGYYIVESALDLKQWYRMTDLTMREKIQLKAELNPIPVKSKKKVVKKTINKADRPEPTAFDKWFN